MANIDTASPLIVNTAADVAWAEAADIVVVGFGGAGAVASIQARECGATVIAIDRFAGGGTTHYSGGVIYAGGTRYLREAGFNDTAEEMYKYLDTEGSALTPATLRRFCEGSNDDIEWLAGHGVPFGANPFLEKTGYPPDPHWLYFSGNEMVPKFAAKAKPAPRGHRVVSKGMGGSVLFAKLREAAFGLGVKLIQHAPVRRLVVDSTGGVVGVEINAMPESLWRKHLALYKKVHPWRPFNGDRAERAIAAARTLEQGVRQTKLIRARRGVILSSGGFVYNLEMVRQHRPLLAKNYRNLLRLGNMGDDGSGITLGESVGGATGWMNSFGVARTLVPPNVFSHGILINQHGKRFFNEGAYAVHVGLAIADQPAGGKAWLIVQARDFWTGVWKSFFPGKGIFLFLFWGAPVLLNIFFGGTRRADTLEKLAKKIGVDSTSLAHTVADFNAAVSAGAPDPFGKMPELMFPLSRGPFFALNMSIDNFYAPAQAITMGGLEVDEDSGAVKRANGSRIEGLYAAGRTAVGVPSKGFLSGLTIADAIFSGRRAARSAAANNLK